MTWSEAHLSQVLTESRSGTWGSPPKGDDGDRPVLRSTNIHDSLLVLDDVALRSVSERITDRYRLLDGDIIVTTSSGSKHLLGKNALFKQPEDARQYLFSNFTLRLRPCHDVIVPSYLHYYLNSSIAKAELLRIQSTTSGLRNLNVPMYVAQPIPLPPLSEQRRIVEILGQADNLRKLRKQADEKAQRILPALFYKMFGDPATNPKGWPVKRLSEVCKQVTDGTHDTPKPLTNAEEGYYLITNKHFMNGRIEFAGAYKISKEDHEAVIARSKPESGDVLYSQIGTLGTGCYVDTDVEFSIKNCALFKPNIEILSGYWLTHLLNNTSFKRTVLSFASGGLQKYLSLRVLRNLELPLPPIGLQCDFQRFGGTADQSMNRSELCTSKINTLFATLLHRAFTGDLTAKWREAHMKELLQEMEEQTKLLNKSVDNASKQPR